MSERSPKASISIEVDRAAGVGLAAVLLREGEPHPARVGQLLRRTGDPLAGLGHRLAVGRQEVGVVEVLAGVAAHVRPAAVEALLGRRGSHGSGAEWWSLVLSGGRRTAGEPGPGEIGRGGRRARRGATGARRGATSRRPSGPARHAVPQGRRRRVRPGGRSGGADHGRGLLTDEVGQAADGSPSGLSERRVVDDEAVDLGVGLDEGRYASMTAASISPRVVGAAPWRRAASASAARPPGRRPRGSRSPRSAKCR